MHCLTGEEAEKIFSTIQAQECESLVEVVRELTKSRNKLMSTKSIQGERIADLQHDFMRVSHIADLSRALSRENIAKAAHLGHCLNQVSSNSREASFVHGLANPASSTHLTHGRDEALVSMFSMGKFKLGSLALGGKMTEMPVRDDKACRQGCQSILEQHSDGICEMDGGEMCTGSR